MTMAKTHHSCNGKGNNGMRPVFLISTHM
jgi:hypothetical protein